MGVNHDDKHDGIFCNCPILKKKKKFINTIAGAILGENFLLAKIYSIDGS